MTLGVPCCPHGVSQTLHRSLTVWSALPSRDAQLQLGAVLALVGAHRVLRGPR